MQEHNNDIKQNESSHNKIVNRQNKLNKTVLLNIVPVFERSKSNDPINAKSFDEHDKIN